ncbi:MAG: zinc ribbon domain-containing protein [Anaerolineales bacterium]|nr:zinc ribbon domain-containing protein [Anaerolineales bacterium]
MRKLFLTFILGILLLFPFSVSAQTNLTLYSVNVQLWPEYDQPSMLVIVDFKVAPMTPLPANLTFRIPMDANLIAVAFATENGDLLNANFAAPTVNDAWQSFTISVEQNVLYRFEYYQPLQFKGNERTFSYSWGDSYAVNNFSVSVLEPMDVVAFSMQPNYVSKQSVNGLNVYESEIVKLAAGDEYTVDLQYEKTSLTLVNAPQPVQPADLIDENTAGRVSLNNFLPYVIGGFGLLFILVGIVYYWRVGRASNKRARRRKNLHVVEEDVNKTGAYCANCGARAKSGDRFCRTCGARLRKIEE